MVRNDCSYGTHSEVLFMYYFNLYLNFVKRGNSDFYLLMFQEFL